MEVEENLFITSPERVQSLFVYCLKKPKTLSDFSLFFKIQTSLYYRNGFLNKLVEKGIFNSEYIGRKLYLYSLFGNEFREYFRQMLKVSSISSEIKGALEKDEDVLLKFFESDMFREFWDENILKRVSRESFKSPNFLFDSFIVFISYPLLYFLLLEELGEVDEKTKIALPHLILYLHLKVFRGSLTPWLLFDVPNYFDDKRLKEVEFLKETECYKLLKKSRLIIENLV